MKKRRLFLIFCIFFVLVLIVVFASPIFKLSNVEVAFIKNGKEVSLSKNTFYNSQKSINNIISSTNFEYGKSIFLLDKSKYYNEIDENNCNLKLLKIETVFPNKLKLNVCERVPTFFVSGTTFILDENLKILDNTFPSLANFELINISFFDCDDNFIDLFNFFKVSKQAFQTGQYIDENNMVFKLFKSLSSIYVEQQNFLNIVYAISIKEQFKGNITVNFFTKSNFGVQIKIEDALNNFDKKFEKVISALITLKSTDKLKTTYGVLSINNNYNCNWGVL